MIDTPGADVWAQLLAGLRGAQGAGAVGPGALEDQLSQAAGFFPDEIHPGRGRVIDLGSGAGLPALPLALAYPDTRWLLVEARLRRAMALRRLVRELALQDRVAVSELRAEIVGHSAERGTADVVTARSFGPAAVTLECAAPLLRMGGLVIVSVAAEDPAWPEQALSELGLVAGVGWQVGRFRYQSALAVRECPQDFPRDPQAWGRSPLF